MDISNKLKKARKEKGLTQRELAKKIDVGISAIGDIESERRLPSKNIAQKLASFFNTTSDYWFNEKEIDEYFSNRKRYAMFDEVARTLIRNGDIQKSDLAKNGDLSEECWDLLKDAVRIELKILLLEKDG